MHRIAQDQNCIAPLNHKIDQPARGSLLCCQFVCRSNMLIGEVGRVSLMDCTKHIEMLIVR